MERGVTINKTFSGGYCFMDECLHKRKFNCKFAVLKRGLRCLLTEKAEIMFWHQTSWLRFRGKKDYSLRIYENDAGRAVFDREAGYRL